MKRTKYLLIIFTSILFTAFLYLLYLNNYSQPNPPISTSFWKTYKNNELGYQFDYPSDSKFHPCTKDEVCNGDGIYTKNYNIAFIYKYKNSNQSFSDWFDSYSKETFNQSWILKQERITFNNYPAIKLTHKSPENTAIQIYYFVYNGQYVIEIKVEDTNLSDNQTISQILSTFKFTDTTSEWKQFNSYKLNLSLKHPSSWFISEYGEYQEPHISLDNQKCHQIDPNCVENENGGNCVVSPDCEGLTVMLITNVTDINTLFDKNKYYSNIEKTTFAGFPAYSATIDWLSIDGSDDPFIYVEVGEKVYQISFSKSNNNSQIDQILSTFKFTN